jgi:hypothetical protein
MVQRKVHVFVQPTNLEQQQLVAVQAVHAHTDSEDYETSPTTNRAPINCSVIASVGSVSSVRSVGSIVVHASWRFRQVFLVVKR